MIHYTKENLDEFQQLVQKERDFHNGDGSRASHALMMVTELQLIEQARHALPAEDDGETLDQEWLEYAGFAPDAKQQSLEIELPTGNYLVINDAGMNGMLWISDGCDGGPCIQLRDVSTRGEVRSVYKALAGKALPEL